MPKALKSFDIVQIEEGEQVLFCAQGMDVEDWMKAQFPARFESFSKVVTFRVPDDRSLVKDFLAAARKEGLTICAEAVDA